MDGTVEAVLRLEDAKRKALVDLDASAYDDHLRAQLRLLEISTPLAIAAQSSSADILALAKLIRLNSLLYHNLLSISPWIQQPSHAYTSGGHFAAGTRVKRFSAEV